MRLHGPELCVLGAIAVRAGVVRLDGHAFPPGIQPLFEWERGVVLIDARSLTDAVDRDLLSDEERAALRLEEAVPLTALDEERASQLIARGRALFEAGYTRHSLTLWLHRLGAEERRSFIGPDGWAVVRGARPRWMQEPRFARLWESRCADRVFRAMSGGVVREGAALFADRLRKWPWERFESVSGDDVERAAHEARAAIAAGEEQVQLPCTASGGACDSRRSRSPCAKRRTRRRTRR